MTAKTFNVTFAASTLLADVYYTFVGVDGTVLIARTNANVVAGSVAGQFSVTIASWDSTKIGTFTWDDSAGNTFIWYVGIRSYNSIDQASGYFASRLYSSVWFNSAILAQQQSLNDASRIIDRFSYKGLPTRNCSCNCSWDDEQDFEHTWPRSGLYMDLYPLDCNTVPKQITEAECEIALALQKGFDPEREMRNASVVSRGYSSVRVAYNPNLVQDYLKWGVPSGAAWNLLLPFLDMDPVVAVRLHRVR